MQKRWQSILLVAALAVFTASGTAAYAIGGDTGGTSGNTGGISGNTGPNSSAVTLLNPLCANGANCQNGTVEGLLQSIVKWLFVIATPIAVGMILIGAFQMLLSGGNEDKFTTGKKTVLYAVIGYAIILIGWGITSIIQSLLSQ